MDTLSLHQERTAAVGFPPLLRTPERRVLDDIRRQDHRCIACAEPIPQPSLEDYCTRHQPALALLLEEDADGCWTVWMAEAGHEPKHANQVLIVGSGPTADEALASARTALGRTLTELAAQDFIPVRRAR